MKHPEFDNFEYHRCVEIQDPHMDTYVEQDDDFLYESDDEMVVREFWSVYGHYREGLREDKGALYCLCDCGNAADASMLCLALNLMFDYAEFA